MRNLHIEHGGIANLAVDLKFFLDLQIANKEVKTANPVYLVDSHNVIGGNQAEVKQVVIFG